MSSTGGCVRVLILSWGPWVKWNERTPPSSAVGVMRTLMDIVARKFGICYEVDAPADLDFGSKLDNGSLTGIIGMLNRSEADMSMVPMSVDYFRSQFVEFSESLIVDEHRLMFKRPTPEADVAGFVKPFTLTIWLALFLSTLLMCTAVFFSECGASFFLRSEGNSKQRVSGSKLKAGGISSHAYHAVLWTVSCLFAQSVPWEPRNVPVRVVAGMWLLASLIVGTVYRSNLKAMLILPKVVLPFDNFEEFAEVDFPAQLLLGGVLEVASREASPNSILAKIRAKSHVDANIWLAVKEVLSGRFAGIASASGQSWLHHSDFSVHGYCRLYTARGGMYSTSVSLGFPKGSALKPKIDFVIRGLKEFGILQYLIHSEIPNGTICFNKPFSSTSASTELRPLELGDFYGIFCLYTGGVVLATLVFIVEHLVKGTCTQEPRVEHVE